MSKTQISNLCERRHLLPERIKKTAEDISVRVEREGDKALFDLTAEIDGVKLKTLAVNAEEFKAARTKVPENLKKAIKTAARNIEIFHKTQIPAKAAPVQTSKGVKCWRRFTPLETAGIYVPGGSAPLFSTALMLALPAKIAGCKNIILCTPPAKDGGVTPEILYAAELCGVSRVFKAGGAQAIFAMAYGTESIPRVDKIFGPGNQYVTAAKMMASSSVAIDMPAGPSEALIIADGSTDPVFAASDILSQAEHGPDSQSVLVSASAEKTRLILKEVSRMLNKLPRKDIAAAALKNSFAVNVKNIKEALAFSNAYAPEHLILNIKNWWEAAERVVNAGSVFCGPLSAEPLGDYASGTNHTLPTAGFARAFGGVNVQSFGKWITYQTATAEGLKTLGGAVMLMAEAEGLRAHANAIKIRRGAQ